MGDETRFNFERVWFKAKVNSVAMSRNTKSSSPIFGTSEIDRINDQKQWRRLSRRTLNFLVDLIFLTEPQRHGEVVTIVHGLSG